MGSSATCDPFCHQAATSNCAIQIKRSRQRQHSKLIKIYLTDADTGEAAPSSSDEHAFILNDKTRRLLLNIRDAADLNQTMEFKRVKPDQLAFACPIDYPHTSKSHVDELALACPIDSASRPGSSCFVSSWSTLPPPHNPYMDTILMDSLQPFTPLHNEHFIAEYDLPAAEAEAHELANSKESPYGDHAAPATTSVAAQQLEYDDQITDEESAISELSGAGAGDEEETVLELTPPPPTLDKRVSVAEETEMKHYLRQLTRRHSQSMSAQTLEQLNLNYADYEDEQEEEKEESEEEEEASSLSTSEWAQERDSVRMSVGVSVGVSEKEVEAEDEEVDAAQEAETSMDYYYEYNVKSAILHFERSSQNSTSRKSSKKRSARRGAAVPLFECK